MLCKTSPSASKISTASKISPASKILSSWKTCCLLVLCGSRCNRQHNYLQTCIIHGYMHEYYVYHKKYFDEVFFNVNALYMDICINTMSITNNFDEVFLMLMHYTWIYAWILFLSQNYFDEVFFNVIALYMAYMHLYYVYHK